MAILESDPAFKTGKEKTTAARWALPVLLVIITALAVAMVVLSHTTDLKDSLITFVIVGFLAQTIDGALGMAYGVSSTTFLLSTGVSPAAASASVHTAEVFTTLVSGLSHLKLGNVDRALFKRLVIPGVLGGVTGAYVLTSLPGDTLKPLVSVYLGLMGVRILWKALRHLPLRSALPAWLFPLGLAGGFFDAIGGGGWGPIVTTTLVAEGNEPRTTIGSVNMAEFFVTLAESITFVLTIKLTSYRTVILGLLIGGVLAAPVAAVVCRLLPARRLMVIVGLVIIGLSVRTILLMV
ncbi:MAG: sulfite exporter TauE/SafE family protein [Anaerolineae bacterium]|nr:sulfite exporter TauE/SafE family protein [Anaerolineae bacterium]